MYAAAHATAPVVMARLVQEKVETFSEVPSLMAFLLEPFDMTDEAWERLQKASRADEILKQVSSVLGQLASFTADAIEAELRALCERLELKPGKVFAPIRFAVTGRTITPGLFESIEVLGQERAIERIELARARLAAVMASVES